MKVKHPELQIDAQIIPNSSLGGLSLRTHVGAIEELIMGLGSWKPGASKLIAPYEARYIFGNGEITAAVDVRTGKIFKLIAGTGYRGALFKGITVGMPVQEAIRLEPRLYYDKAEEMILCRGVPGLTLDVGEIDPPPELVSSLTISTISVEASEAFNLQGQTGGW